MHKRQLELLKAAQGFAIDSGSFIEFYDEPDPTDMAIYNLAEAVRLLAAGLSEEVNVNEYIDARIAETRDIAAKCPECACGCEEAESIEGLKPEETPKIN